MRKRVARASTTSILFTCGRCVPRPQKIYEIAKFYCFSLPVDALNCNHVATLATKRWPVLEAWIHLLLAFGQKELAISRARAVRTPVRPMDTLNPQNSARS